jgi:hypothetical protein
LLGTIVDQVTAEYRETLVPAIERVWKDEIEQLRGDLRSWLRRTGEVNDGWMPSLIEYGFGVVADTAHDPESISDAVTLAEGFKLHGIVDLVERKNGMLRITDTKTGKNDTIDGTVTGHGEKLQPVLYSLAVEKARGATVAEARLAFPTSAGGFSHRVIPINEFSRNEGLEVLRIIDTAVATGFLPPAPRERGCDYCDFRPVCGPYEHRRAAKKDPTPLENLIRLRGMP